MITECSDVLEIIKDSQLHKEELVSNLSETFRPTFPDAEFCNLFLLVILAFFLNFNLLSIASILRDRNWSKLLLLSCLVHLLYEIDCLWFEPNSEHFVYLFSSCSVLPTPFEMFPFSVFTAKNGWKSAKNWPYLPKIGWNSAVFPKISIGKKSAADFSKISIGSKGLKNGRLPINRPSW